MKRLTLCRQALESGMKFVSIALEPKKAPLEFEPTWGIPSKGGGEGLGRFRLAVPFACCQPPAAPPELGLAQLGPKGAPG